jgi:REP element-mobilizing transposase RayT
MSRLVRKSHNVSVLVYHVVCVAKYRRVVFDESVEAVLREVCLDIALRFEVTFLEIGTDGDHVHFLVQSVPTYSPTKIVTTLKSVTAREVFARCPHVKKKLWGGEFWSDGYFIASVGQQESEETVRKYVKEQGQNRNYRQLHAQAADTPPDSSNQSYTP